MNETKSDFEIGDSVVFGTRTWTCDPIKNWRSGRITDIAGDVMEIEFRSLFGFFRRKWVKEDERLHVRRKERAEELLAKYKA